MQVNNLQGTIVHTFEVRHNNGQIGSVKFGEKEPAAKCLKIFPKNAHPQLIVRSLKLGDFAVNSFLVSFTQELLEIS